MDYYKLAKVLKPQGLKGELKLKPYTDDPERFYDLSHIFIKKNTGYVEYAVESARLYKQFAYLKLTGVESCEQAEMLRNAFLYIDKASAKKPEGTYFIADLIGMTVKSTDGDVLGAVSNVFNTGSVDIYSVNGEKSIMFPAAPDVIADIDEESGVILVNAVRFKEVAVYD